MLQFFSMNIQKEQNLIIDSPVYETLELQSVIFQLDRLAVVSLVQRCKVAGNMGTVKNFDNWRAEVHKERALLNKEALEGAELKSLSLPSATPLQIGKVSLKFRSATPSISLFPYRGRTMDGDLTTCTARRLLYICTT